MRALRTRFFVVLVLAAAYESFVDEAIVSEAIAAMVVGVVTWLVAERILRVGRTRGRISLAFIRPFFSRIPYAAIRESLDLLGPVLWRSLVRHERVTGRWIALRYRACDRSKTYERGRRSIVIFASNLTPNALPLDIDIPSERMVLHQLVKRRESAAGDPTYPI